MIKFIQTVLFMFVLTLAPKALAQDDTAVPAELGPVDPNSCTNGYLPLSINEFARWDMSQCMATFETMVRIENQSKQCRVLSWDGYVTTSLVPMLDTWEDGQTHRVSLAINTGDGIRACLPACSVAYAEQPSDRAVLNATGYRLPIGVPPVPRTINRARMLLMAAKRFDAVRNLTTYLMATKTDTQQIVNLVGRQGGTEIEIKGRSSADCPNLH